VTTATAVRTPGVTTTRAVTVEIFADLRNGEFLDQSFERRTGPLDARDRRWMRELVYGSLRKRARIDALLSSRVRGTLSRLDPDVLDLLRIGVYQLLHMGSVPAYAAIAQTVELAKRRHGLGASKLVNAVLRRLDREREDLGLEIPTDPIERLALVHSHPQWLVQRWVERWGTEETGKLLALNDVESPVIVRPYGIVREQLEAALEAGEVTVADAPLATDSVLLGGNISLTELGAFRQGQLFVQDPAATMVTEYAAIPAGAFVADLCAAPGGKAIELSRTAGVVIAADRSFARLDRVVANRRRLDVANLIPLVADAKAPAIREADAVLLDVPCTGTGTFRRHPDARWRLKISDIAVMAATQRTILKSASTVVKHGGLLIYSTCSLEPEENESQIETFLAANAGWKLEPPPEGTVPADTLDGGYLRVLPQRHGTDGAFAARLRRTD
jgi:16S rRNA (cytosine967-C5)-methyltransferase